MVFYWGLSDSKSTQVSRILLSILADLNNAVVWMVSTRPLISKSSRPFINPSVTVAWAPITNGINVIFLFHNFFNSRARSWYLSFFLLSFKFTLLSTRTAKSTILQVFSFLLLFLFIIIIIIIIRSGRLAEIRWSVCMSISHRTLCVTFSRIDDELCICSYGKL